MTIDRREMLEAFLPEQIDDALERYHAELASHLLGYVKRPVGDVVELGAGTGAFTIPFLTLLGTEYDSYTCIDPYPGPYYGGKGILRSRLNDLGTSYPIEILELDARGMDAKFMDLDLVIGHEMLCDLDRKGIKGVMQAVFNSLKQSGRFIHSEFSPLAASREEELVMISNEFCQEPVSGATWFSPPDDYLIETAEGSGFSKVDVHHFEIPVRFKRDAALSLLQRWLVDESFFDDYAIELMSTGLKLPREQILVCEK